MFSFSSSYAQVVACGRPFHLITKQYIGCNRAKWMKWSAALVFPSFFSYELCCQREIRETHFDILFFKEESERFEQRKRKKNYTHLPSSVAILY